jgi:hypothetical protein
MLLHRHFFVGIELGAAGIESYHQVTIVQAMLLPVPPAELPFFVREHKDVRISPVFEHKLLEQGVTATQLSEAAGRTAAANQISIANSIGSLRFIGAMDWKNYVESLSVVEQTLREDPAGMYTSQDFATRDRYRHVIEDVARGTRSRSELRHAKPLFSRRLPRSDWVPTTAPRMSDTT